MSFSYDKLIKARQTAETFRQDKKFRTDIRTKIKKPPTNYQYDDFGSKKINRVVDHGTYKSIELKKFEEPLGDPFSFAKSLNRDLYMISDLNLNAMRSRSDLIAHKLNAQVSSNEHLLFIGNMLTKKSADQWGVLKTFMDQLICKHKYLILGESDMLLCDDYINLGFEYVTDRADKTIDGKKVIFTYFPMVVGRGEFNIHGHVDSPEKLGPMNPQRHFSVYCSEDNDYKAYTFKDVKGSVSNNGNGV